MKEKLTLVAPIPAEMATVWVWGAIVELAETWSDPTAELDPIEAPPSTPA